MKKDLIIFGSKSAAIVVLTEILQLKMFNVIGFVDDYVEADQPVFKWQDKTYFTLGSTQHFFRHKINDLNTRNLRGVMGVGFNHFKKKIVDQVFELSQNFEWQSIISKNSTLNGICEIGEGTVILSGVTVNTGTKFGRFCKINTSSSIDHDNVFSDYASCGPSVVTGGKVIVGKNSYLGIGSTIKHGIKIGANSVIGGGSFVNKDCEGNSLYYGVPARRVKERKPEENYLV